MNRWTGKEVSFLKENYQVLSIAAIATALGRSHQAVKIKGHHLGLRQKVVNHKFFSEWSTEMAWVLGFWAADGCVVYTERPGKDGLTMSFSQKDGAVLEDIKALIGSNHPVSRDKTSGVHAVAYNSTQQYEDLCEIFGADIVRKSNTMPFPNVPDEYLVPFLRGCWDGDGSVYWNHRSGRTYPCIQYTSGSENFINGLDDALRANTRIAGVTVFPQRGYYVFVCSGVRAQEVARFLYSKDGPGLKRKKCIALEFEKWEPKYIRKGTLKDD